VIATLPSNADLAALSTNWYEQDELLQLELEESLSALEAYERQLDAWREQLVAERTELQAQREAQREALAEQTAKQTALQSEVDDDRAELQAKLKYLTSELTAERQSAAMLTTTQLAELADLRSELADCEHRRQQSDLAAAKMATEVATLKLRESELAALLAATQLSAAFAPNPANANASATHGSNPPSSEPTKRSGSDPVVGSVVAQFDKLRLQRQAAKQGRST
jgi:DNA repair exonuclease SbcCD ATPase subunit